MAACEDLSLRDGTAREARFVRAIENCFVRAHPRAGSAILGVARRGSELTCAGEAIENGWLRTEYNGQTGWVSGRYVVRKGDGS